MGDVQRSLLVRITRATTINDFEKLGTALGGTPTIVERLRVQNVHDRRRNSMTRNALMGESGTARTFAKLPEAWARGNPLAGQLGQAPLQCTSQHTYLAVVPRGSN